MSYGHRWLLAGCHRRCWNVRSRGYGRILLALSVVAWLCVGFAASANELALNGFNSRSISLSEAVMADVNDLSALYYNPAGIGATSSQASLDLLFSMNLLHIDYFTRPQGDASVDVPSDVYRLSAFPNAPSSAFTLATADLPNARKNQQAKDFSTAMVLGATLNLSAKVKAAVAGYFPVVNPGNATMYPDSREQYFSNSLRFSVIDQRAPGPIVYIGAGAQPFKWARIGATVLMFRQRTDELQTLLSNPNASETSVLIKRSSERSLGASFNAGLQIDVTKVFSVGVAYRHRIKMGEDIVSSADVNDYTVDTPPLGSPRYSAKTSFVYDFNPSELGLGVRLGNHCPWALYADVIWRMWSQYDNKDDGNPGKEFHDIVIPRLGFEYEIKGWWDLRLGAQYTSNAVYEQDGETNHVDNDRINGSLGMRFELPWPKEAQLDLHFQFAGLVPRTFRKNDDKMVDEFPVVTDEETGETVGDAQLQTNNPGYPGYESGGLMLAFGTALSVPF